MGFKSTIQAKSGIRIFRSRSAIGQAYSPSRESSFPVAGRTTTGGFLVIPCFSRLVDATSWSLTNSLASPKIDQCWVAVYISSSIIHIIPYEISGLFFLFVDNTTANRCKQ